MHQIELEMQNEELRKSREELEKTLCQYTDLYDFAPVGYFTLDRRGTIHQANLTGSKLLGMERKPLVGMRFARFLSETNRTSFNLFLATVFADPASGPCDRTLQMSGPSPRYIHLRASVSENGQTCHAVVEDTTWRWQTEEALRERERMLSTLISNLPGFVYRCINDKNWTMEYISDGCLAITGYPPEDFIRNRRLAYNDIVHPDYQEPLWQKWQELLEQKKAFEEEYPIITAGQQIRWVWERGRGIFSDEGRLLFLEGFITDITDRKRLEEAMHTLAIRDELTGLYNRRGFFTLAQQQLKIAERTKKAMVLFYVDLNGMKRINDQWGHQEGDRALVDVTGILKKTFREADIIARVGGDEFTALVIDVSDLHPRSLTARMQDYLDICNREGQRKYLLSLSTGIAHYDPDAPVSLDELIARADERMYAQKRKNE